MNIDTTKIRKEITNTNAFNFDSFHLVNDNSELRTYHLKYDTLLQNNNAPVITNNEDRWQGVDISIYVSIITFILGFIIAEFIRRWNKSNELNQYKQFIEEWVNKSNISLEYYIKSLKTFSSEIKANTDFNIPKWETGIIHLSKINSISLEKYSDIYIFGISNNIEGENRKQLMNFLYQLEYIEKCPSVIMNIYDEYCKQNEKIMEEWNLYYMQLIDLFQANNDIKLAPHEKKIFDEIMELFMPLLIEAGKGIIIATDKWSSKFIEPSIKILSIIHSAPSQPLLQSIKLIKGLRIVLFKYDNNNKFNEVFNDYAESLETAQTKINESMEYFKKKNIKRFCK